MPKVAHIVTFSVSTRVVVDIPDNEVDKHPFDWPDDLFNEVVNKASEKVIADAPNYIYAENVDSIDEDTECPAGTFDGD